MRFLSVLAYFGAHLPDVPPWGVSWNREPCRCGAPVAAVLQDATPRRPAPVASDPRPASAAVLLDDPTAATDPRPAPVAVGVIPYYI